MLFCLSMAINFTKNHSVAHLSFFPMNFPAADDSVVRLFNAVSTPILSQTQSTYSLASYFSKLKWVELPITPPQVHSLLRQLFWVFHQSIIWKWVIFYVLGQRILYFFLNHLLHLNLHSCFLNWFGCLGNILSLRTDNTLFLSEAQRFTATPCLFNRYSCFV